VSVGDGTPPVALKLGAVAYIVGGLSFVPLAGVPFGLVAIVWGLRTKRRGGKNFALAGLLGILFTALICGLLLLFGAIGQLGVYRALRHQVAQSALDSLVPAIETYRIQHGVYPATLEDLRKTVPKDAFLMIFDPTDGRILPRGQNRQFFYERVDNDHYYLRSVGPDGQPFTADDIVPEVDPATADKLGLLLTRPAEEPKR